MVEFNEMDEGVLVSTDKSVIKVRESKMLPHQLSKYFKNKSKVSPKEIREGGFGVYVASKYCSSYFDSGLFHYVDETVNLKRDSEPIEKCKGLLNIGTKVEWYLSNIPLDKYSTECYPLFAKYRYGWVVVSPLEVC